MGRRSAEVLPEVLFARPLGGLELWQWLGLLLAFGGALIGGWALERWGWRSSGGSPG